MLGLLRRGVRPGPRASSAGAAMNLETVGAGLYVDTENLQKNAQSLVETVIEQWPEGTPPPSRLNLYVQADRVTLWDIWANSRFPNLTVTVKGIQHFTRPQSKNSADIAIAIDAVADFVTGATRFTAVMSDDSDFMPLFAKLKELAGREAPFLWLMTDRTRTKASTVGDFFPNDHIHVVRLPATQPPSPVISTGTEGGAPEWSEIAECIIREIPIGAFKSVDCQPIIASRWPDHPMASMPGPQLGVEFVNKLWPILGEKGVRLMRSKPRKYEMTSEAKDAVP